MIKSQAGRFLRFILQVYHKFDIFFRFWNTESVENNFSENVQPNQLSQPITAQQPSFSKKKYSFGKIFWIFFIASVLIAFLAGGYF
ncbi:MAG: hypothetical protein Q8P10_03060, partial [bacterium]|nr:hypothetical protein [bacterium]